MKCTSLRCCQKNDETGNKDQEDEEIGLDLKNVNLKSFHVGSTRIPLRGLITLIGGILLMSSNAVDFSYGERVCKDLGFVHMINILSPK